jgi:hypothetical protein
MCGSCRCCGSIVKPIGILLAIASLVPLIYGIVACSTFKQFEVKAMFA